MLNARKIQQFVTFISRLFLRYPKEAFCPLIYEFNISTLPAFEYLELTSSGQLVQKPIPFTNEKDF